MVVSVSVAPKAAWTTVVLDLRPEKLLQMGRVRHLREERHSITIKSSRKAGNKNRRRVCAGWLFEASLQGVWADFLPPMKARILQPAFVSSSFRSASSL